MSEGDVLELQHLTSLFKNSPLPAAVTDGSLNVLWSNPPAKEALPCLRLQDAFSLLLDEKARAAAIRSLALGESPVSYTHLDVYKRQIRYRRSLSHEKM